MSVSDSLEIGIFVVHHSHWILTLLGFETRTFQIYSTHENFNYIE